MRFVLIPVDRETRLDMETISDVLSSNPPSLVLTDPISHGIALKQAVSCGASLSIVTTMKHSAVEHVVALAKKDFKRPVALFGTRESLGRILALAHGKAGITTEYDFAYSQKPWWSWHIIVVDQDMMYEQCHALYKVPTWDQL